MSVVIIGGNDRMHFQYKNICSKYNYKAKIFTQMPSDLKNRIGNPDLIVLFTNTVSHKMIITASQKAEKNNINIVKCHSSSSSALEKIIEQHAN